MDYPLPKYVYPKSPLRYPGGKARAVSIVLSMIPKGTKNLVSPFFGGGSIEIACAKYGIKVKGFDIFKPLVVFWKYLLRDSNSLADQVLTYFPLPKTEFYELQDHDFKDDLDSAAIYYVLNRASYSGATLSGGMSPGHPRFTSSSIDYLRNFNIGNLSVQAKDFNWTFSKYPNELMYLDPPYMITSALYGKNGNTQKEFDHEGLAKLLGLRSNWILSYNNSLEVKNLYSRYRMFEPAWKYGMSTDKASRELIIVSNDYPEDLWRKYA